MQLKSVLSLVLLTIACGEGALRDTEEASAEVAADEWVTYESERWGVSLRHPSSWTVFETSDDAPLQAINVYPIDSMAAGSLPITIHAPAGQSQVGFYPLGWGTELPTGDAAPVDSSAILEVSFPLQNETPPQSLELRAADGEPWAWFLRPAETPSGWSREAYLFAQAAMPDVEIRCFDRTTGECLAAGAVCDPMEGDRIERHGGVDAEAREVVISILASIEWLANPSDLVVSRPHPQALVESPLEIVGEAVGPWFFEAVFPITLTTADGTVLATASARAEGEWMTRQRVPFRARLEFEPQGATRGRLILQNDNPSGLPENERRHEIPVRFVR